MAKLLTVIIGYALGSFLVRVFTALGIGVFTYKALYGLVNNLLDLIQPMFSQLPSGVISILSIAGVPEGLSIIASALLTRAAIQAARAWVGVVA